jgi:RNA recognition motif-containing protein
MNSKHFVFVGNISPLTPKEDIIKILSDIGPLNSFKMVLDKETGKPRGYGFAEYGLETHAYNASRALNGKELHGRPLKVDLCENKGIQMPNDSMESKVSIGTEIIRDSLLTLPRNQISNCMSLIKKCAEDDPEALRKVLRQNPTLSLVILFAESINEGHYDQKVTKQAPKHSNPAIAQLMQTMTQQQLQQIMAMTPQQIGLLRPEQQQQIITIQQEMANYQK